MSWKLTGLVARKRVGNATRRLILLSMSDKANDDGTGVYASFATIAHSCELSRATAKRVIKDMESEKLVKCVGTRACKNGATNIYTLNVSAIRALPDLDAKLNPVQAEPGSDDDAPPVNPVQDDPATRFSLTPKPIQKPSFSSNELKESGDASPKAVSKPKRASAYSPEFEKFWRMWPAVRRERSDKRTAAKRWVAARERWDAETLYGTTKRYLALPSVTKEGFQFCCLAEVFLNGKLEASVEAYQANLGSPDDMPWPERLRFWDKFQIWQTAWGPRPTDPGYKGPPQ